MQREREAEAGTIFSGGRARRETGLASAADRSLQALQSSALSRAGSLGRSTEGVIGSSALSNIVSPTISRYGVSLAGEGAFSPLEGRSLFNTQGGLTGSLERERLTAINTRRNQLEEAARRSRVLNFYGI